jgi:hypothetical protein
MIIFWPSRSASFHKESAFAFHDIVSRDFATFNASGVFSLKRFASFLSTLNRFLFETVSNCTGIYHELNRIVIDKGDSSRSRMGCWATTDFPLSMRLWRTSCRFFRIYWCLGLISLKKYYKSIKIFQVYIKIASLLFKLFNY